MKRYFFLTSLFLCSLITAPSYAQDNVPLRTGARDGYSRITFGWTQTVSYSLDTSGDGILIIKFGHPAKTDLSHADFSVLDNVSAVKVISTDPLTLSLRVPESSKVRDFRIGKRVVLDIYDPSDPKEAKSFETASVEAQKKTETHFETVVVKKVKAPHSKEKMPPPVGKKLSATPPAFVLVPEKLPEKKALDKEDQNSDKKTKENTQNRHAVNENQKALSAAHKKLSSAVKDEHHVISLRSTKSIDIAVFENYGELWLVMGGGASYVVPGFSSSTPEIFSPLLPMSMENSTSYHMRMPETPLRIKAKGGGLIWDVIIGEKVKERPSIQPVRFTENSPNFHGEKLIWSLKGAHDIIDLSDPITGEMLKVVLVDDAKQFSGEALSYIDFDVLKSSVGMIIRPKVDDLHVKVTEAGVEVYRSSGLRLASGNDTDEARIFSERLKSEAISQTLKNNGSKEHVENFFRFKDWQLGSARNLGHNEHILLSGMKGKSDSRRIEDLLALGKMFLSHGLGAEALGYLHYAGNELPGLHESAEFVALRGVAKALDWKSDAALEDFLFKELEDEEEVKYWKSFVLADLGDWQQAAKTLPDHYDPLYDYPNNIGHRLALVLAEVNLRDGNVKAAEELLALVEKNKSDMIDPMVASLKYLRGEAYRQKNQKDKTKKIWKKLTKDKDDLYRTKAGLALTILLASEGEINNSEAIDRLERLRYAWRGDELEAQVNYWLGDAYFKDKEFIKGLSIMRDAASIAGNTALGQRIANYMGKTFTDLFLGEDLKTISAVDAVSLYETFSELTPVGTRGDTLIQNLAEHLVRAGLLGRATKYLRHQVVHRLKGKDKLRVAIRLAAIELINKDPQKAMDALGQATDTLHFLSDTPEKEQQKGEIALLRIRAYSQNKQFDKALSLLKKMETSKAVSRLKADIAWQAGYWDEAAEALGVVLQDENISMTRPLTQEQSDLVLNRAIALSLSNDRIALGNMRAKYSDLMIQTHKAHQFEVITRRRSSSALADRETLLSVVSEVDLFKDFLDSYRAARP
ncbi:MAG: hypothetical protein COA45_09670 [Zetaproteobacteria bacterium]|nr:MAG: hypothetical protein COA45_09670 [Zetaproteobacteria bacterium]